MNGAPPPFYDLDEDLLAAVRAGSPFAFRCYPCAITAVVLGRGSRIELEADAAACRARGVPLLRRRGGGCAVLLDPGSVIASSAFRQPGIGGVPAAFSRALDWLLAGLAAMGLTGLSRQGVSDLAKDGRKVAGTCLYRSKDLVYFSASLLVRPDLDLVEACLPHPPREPAWRAGRSHREFMSAGLGGGLDAAAFAAQLSRELESALDRLHGPTGE